MLNISKLYCGIPSSGDSLRYSSSTHKRPVVVWNCTRTCNLNCFHCYSDSHNLTYPNEMTTDQAKAMMNDMADFDVPVVLISGGEPLMRKDVFDLANYATDLGLKCVLSTNGTLLTRTNARRIRESGFSYVGISLDGTSETHDRLRGVRGAYAAALRGVENCKQEGVRTGLRVTITRQTVRDLDEIYKTALGLKIQRLCLYHLVYAGRGKERMNEDLSIPQMRRLMDYLLQASRNLSVSGQTIEVLTVDNHTDGAYLYLKLEGEDSRLATSALELLRVNGGNSSGIGIGCVDSYGYVHPDQFWRHYSLGNVKLRKFGEIWTDTSEPLLGALKSRKSFLKGRCSRCRFLEICNGNFRVRAEAVTGDLWAPDPACYLTDEEIGDA